MNQNIVGIFLVEWMEFGTYSIIRCMADLLVDYADFRIIIRILS